MATPVEEGNRNIFGSTTAQASVSRENMIVDKTKALAFPSGPIISLENFEHHGDRPAGSVNTVNDMVGLTGKVLQQSYRAGLSESAEYHEKVADR